jgi:hypothetical protein
MRHEKHARALRPVPVLAVLGAALAGCGLPSEGRYGGGSGYYGSSSHYNSYSHHRPRNHHRSDGHRPRAENWSQDRLRQNWANQAQRAR